MIDNILARGSKFEERYKVLSTIGEYNAEALKANPDSLFAILSSDKPPTSVIKILDSDPEFAERFYKNYLTGTLKKQKVLVKLAKPKHDFQRVHFIEQKIAEAGAGIPQEIKEMSNSREARRALSALPASSGKAKMSCGRLLQMLYLKQNQ